MVLHVLVSWGREGRGRERNERVERGQEIGTVELSSA